MTSPTSAASSSRLGTGRRRGFTITEILVVVGVIVLLMGILLPTIGAARKSARRTRLASDLNSISVALEAYKADHGDYPRLPPGGLAGSPTPGTAPNVWGAQLLTWALLAPAKDMPTGPSTYDGDGADGNGFRIRRPAGNANTTPAVGRVYGPYLDTGKFKLNVDLAAAGVNPNEAMILDSAEGPIFYYPAHPKPAQANVNEANGYVGDYVAAHGTSGGAASLAPLFNASHNDKTAGAGITLEQLRARLGADASGKVDTTKNKPVQTVPYLLWSTGLDGKFGGPDDPTGADDVTNLQQ